MKKRTVVRAGFTLIEILLVILILAMLAGVAIVTFSGTREGAKIDTTKLMLTEIETSLDIFNSHMNRYPTTDEGLDALRKKPADEEVAKKWRGPYLKKQPKDAWDKALHYELVEDSTSETGGLKYKLWSEGPDKQNETDDDIKSWSEETES